MRRMALLLVGVACLGVPGRAGADTFNPAVEYASSDTAADMRPFTLGYQFTTSVSMDVNALAYLNDGLANNHEVGIWDSTGTLLTSATVLGTDPLQGHFLYHSISDLILAPGTYTIGGEYLGNNDPFTFFATGVVTIPGFTWVTDEQTAGSGLNYPTFTTGGGYGNNGILVVDFSVNAVPEPGSLVLLGSAAVAVAVRTGLRRRNRAPTA